MKSIMISIQPQWVEKILNGEKTIEIRKTKPSCELPCKAYIYCTKGKSLGIFGVKNDGFILENINGKVVAEFTLNKVDFIKMPIDLPKEFQEKSCVNGNELMKYLGGEFYKDFYAWHIDNLKIYDKPKALSEFRKDLDCDDYPCNKNRDCKYNYYDYSEGCWACGIDFDGANCIYKQLKRPPQSWCYVED